MVSLALDILFAWLLERRFPSWLILAPLALVAGLASSALGGMTVAAGLGLLDPRGLPLDPGFTAVGSAIAHPAITWWVAAAFRRRRSDPGRLHGGDSGR